jgi:hypothetical protein
MTQAPGTRNRHLTYFALMEALEGEGCPICALVLRSLERYFDSLVYERVNDRGIRKELRASYGYCAAHGEMLRQARSALGSSILHRDLLNTLSRHLEQVQLPPKTPRDLLRGLLCWNRSQPGEILTTAQPCPACVHVREIEQGYVDTLLVNWSSKELQDAFRRSAGLCLSHVRMALERATDPDTFQAIKEAQVAAWQELLDELDEFIRKQDYRYSHEALGDEGDAWSRAIDLVSGLWQVAGSHRR